ncbi:hypothetical protein MMC18_002357 [Xylographa bjoerkii]|nr:hypothetical protein [Xylographa bjoerkii]
MGYQKDQSFTGTTYRPGAQPPSDAPQRGIPPPLPPRAAFALLKPVSSEPPPYERVAHEYHSQPLTHSWSGQDPRERSTESLVPSGEGEDGRRTLLLIFIHGFLGNETSFQSFPAHIHNLVTTKLVDTHTVHTKIYPRYKSRKAIEYARDDFSNWLCPNETPETDVILLGHSMGGILSAEVALLGPYSAADRRTYRHRILGTINFDTPFLGMHPGVIVSGIGSLFKAKPASPTLKPVNGTEVGNSLMPMPQQLASPNGTFAGSGLLPMQGSEDPSNSGYFPDQTSESSRTPISPLSPLATPINDPNFDPPFPNDVRLPVRKGWDSTLHFIMKHSDGLTKATKSYVTSHLEFGGAMADYRGLKARYERLRALEDVDDSEPEPMQEYRPARRIRFVNYYTASTGRSSSPKPATAHEKEHTDYQPGGTGSGLEERLQRVNLSTASNASTRSASRSPRISIENPRGELVAEIVPDVDENEDLVKDETHSDQGQDMEHLEPGPVTDDEEMPGDGASESKIISPATYQQVPLDISSANHAESVHTPNTEPTTPSQHLSTQSSTLSSTSTLPPLPRSPTPPPPFDPSPYPDKDTRKLAEKEHARLTKTYQRALKDRDAAIKDRRKLLEKREKAARQAREKAVKDDEKARLKDEATERKALEKAQAAAEKEDSKRLAAPLSATEPAASAAGDSHALAKAPAAASQRSAPDTGKTAAEATLHAEKPKRDRKFCMLPPRGADGERDPCWPRVFMEGVDEVGAHCGLFVAGKPHYAALVLDVGGRVEAWVRERRHH